MIRVSPGTRSSELSGLSASQIVELPRGSRLTIAELRSLGKAAGRLRSPGRGLLRQPLSGRTLPIHSATELAQIESAPDTTVLQLPDGRRITAGQFKAVLPNLRKGGASAARIPARAVVKVARGTPIQELLRHADSDVLESPGGKRVTVGELRRLWESLPPELRR